MSVPERAAKEAAAGAAMRVAELLAVPDDLLRVVDIRTNLIKESVALEAKLKAEVHTKLQQARSGLVALDQSSSLVTSIQQNFTEVDETCQHCEELFGRHYEIIREVDRTRRNLYITKRLAARMNEIPNAVRNIRILLQDNRKLLEVHKEIRQLEYARHAALIQVWEHEREVAILREKFNIVDAVAEQFEQRLWSILENCLELCISSPWVIVKVMQVIEREEVADELTCMRSRGSVKRSSSNISDGESREGKTYGRGLSPRSMEPRDRRRAQPQQPIRGYQGMWFSTMQSMIAKRFEDAIPRLASNVAEAAAQSVATSSGGGRGSNAPAAAVDAKSAAEGSESAPDEVARVLNILRKRLAELPVIKGKLIPCFPPRYDAWNFFVREYRQHIATVLEAFAAEGNRLLPRQILSIVQWVPGICERFLHRLGANTAGPPLIELLSSLMDIYQNSIKNLLMDWAGRIVANDRKQKPLEDRDGLLFTDAPTNLFEFINQQLNFVELTLYQPFIFGVLQECCAILSNYKLSFMEMLKISWVNLPYGYLLACMNNFHTCRSKTENLAERVQELLSPALAEELFLKRLGKSFEVVGERASWAAEQVIFRDVEPALLRLFSKEWCTDEEDQCIEAVVDTLEDYFSNDTSGYIQDEDLKKLQKRCIDRLVASYVREMLTKKNKFSKKCFDQLEDDVKRIRQLAVEYFPSKHSNKMVMVLLNLTSVILIDDVKLLTPHIESLVKRNRDFSLAALEALLSMCKHHKKNFGKRVLQVAEEFVTDGQVGSKSDFYHPTYPYFTQMKHSS